MPMTLTLVRAGNQALPAGIGLEAFEEAVFALIADLELSDKEPEVGFWEWMELRRAESYLREERQVFRC